MRKERQFKVGRCYHQGSRVAHRAFTFDGAKTYTYDYHVDGQLARADYGNGNAEDFGWDGLALIKRGDERFVNEPHVGNAPKKLRFEGKPRAQRSARRARKGPRDNPVASSKGTKYFNDMLGTTLGAKSGKYGKYTHAALTAFGEDLSASGTKHQAPSTSFYTGKPEVAGLGHAFLMRNYRASLAKWQTADPLGYPDGWNQLAYCGNGVIYNVDLVGCAYDSAGLNQKELEELYVALHSYLALADSWFGDISAYAFNQFWPKLFFTRYVDGLGDCNLSSQAIEGTSVYMGIERFARNSLKRGAVNIPDYHGVFSGEWYYALGQIVAKYNVIDQNDHWLVTVTIDDLYDFHDNGQNVPLKWFSLFWGGGDVVYDRWLCQLQEMKVVFPYWTHIEWMFNVMKE